MNTQAWCQSNLSMLNVSCRMLFETNFYHLWSRATPHYCYCCPSGPLDQSKYCKLACWALRETRPRCRQCLMCSWAAFGNVLVLRSKELQIHRRHTAIWCNFVHVLILAALTYGPRYTCQAVFRVAVQLKALNSAESSHLKVGREISRLSLGFSCRCWCCQNWCVDDMWQIRDSSKGKRYVFLWFLMCTLKKILGDHGFYSAFVGSFA